MFQNLIQYTKTICTQVMEACLSTKVNPLKNLRLFGTVQKIKANYNCRESNKFIKKKPLVDTITSKKGSHKFPTR